MALETSTIVQVTATLTKSLDLLTATAPVAYKKEWAWPSGTGVNQADKIFSDIRSLAGAGNDDIDLVATLTDALGDTLNFAKIRALIVEPSSANAAALTINNSVANAFTTPFGGVGQTLAARPGGAVALIARDTTAYAVSSGTGDILRITNSAANSAASYKLVVIGTS